MADKVYHSVLERVIDDLRRRPSREAHDPYYLSNEDWSTCLDEIRCMRKTFIPSAAPDCPEAHFLLMGAPIIPRAVA